MAAVSEPTLTLCGTPALIAGWESCPLESGHKGKCLCWTQTGQRRRNGVWVRDRVGTAILHATFDGVVTAEEVCATLAILDVLHERDQP